MNNIKIVTPAQKSCCFSFDELIGKKRSSDATNAEIFFPFYKIELDCFRFKERNTTDYD